MVSMRPRRPFQLIYAPSVRGHLRAIRPKYYSLIQRQIEEQLRYEADVETVNRKRLGPTIALEAQWELRCGVRNEFRVFYEVDVEARTVRILAVGVKRGTKLRIGREEIDL